MSERQLLLFITYLFMILSLTGCFFIFVASCILKSYKKPIGLMILLISITNFFTSFPFLDIFAGSHTIFVCKIYYIVFYYCTMSSFFWVWCISYCLVKLFLMSNNSEIPNVFSFQKYALISLIGPSPTMLIILFSDYVSLEDGHCTVGNNSEEYQPIIGILLIYLPLVLTVVFTIVSYVIILVQLRKFGSEDRQYVKVKWTSLYAHSLILMLCWLPYFIVSIFVESPTEHLPTAIFLIILKLPQLQSVFNAIVFGCSSSVRTGFRQKCCRMNAEDAGDDSTGNEIGFGGSLYVQDPNQTRFEDEDSRAVTIADSYYKGFSFTNAKQSLVT